MRAVSAPVLGSWQRADRRLVSWTRSVGVGVGLALAAALAKAVVSTLTGGDLAYLLLFAATALAALIGGVSAGITAALVGAALDVVSFQEPTGTLTIADPALAVRLVLFLPTAILIAVLIGQLGAARRLAADSARRWSTLLGESPDATLLARVSDGVVVYASDRWTDLGWSPDQLVGNPLTRVFPAQPDRPTTGDPEPLVVRLTAPSGRDVPVEILVAEVDLGDEGRGLLVSARDVGERMATQSRLLRLAKAERARASELAAIIASINDPVAVLDPDGTVTLANDALGELARGPVRDRAQVLDVLGLPPDSPLGGAQPTTRDVRLHDPDRWLEIRTLPVAGPESEQGSQLVLIRDVTGEREAQTAREAFIGILSHELRTPITTILGLSTVLARPTTNLDEEQRRDVVQDIVGEAQRLHHLVEDLLVLSRAERSELQLDPEPVLVRHAIDRVVDAERRRFPQVRFEVSSPPGLPPVAGDRTFVDQVLRNLIGNAAKYGPLHGSVVEVTAERQADDVVVRVLDQGPGFDPTEAERLFDLFYRSDRTARQRAGAGIGLYVTRSLVHLMDGRVWARLRPEGGSEFGFSLPVITASDEERRLERGGTAPPDRQAAAGR